MSFVQNSINALCNVWLTLMLLFNSCSEKDSLESITRKLISSKGDNMGHGVWLNLTLFNGDLKQVSCPINTKF